MAAARGLGDIELGSMYTASAAEPQSNRPDQDPGASSQAINYDKDEEFDGSDDVVEASRRRNKLPSTLWAIVSILVYAFFFLFPAALIWLSGGFEVYSFARIKVSSPVVNSFMEFIRWSIFFYVAFVGYIIIEWSVGAFPNIILQLLKKIRMPVNVRTRRLISYFVAARYWFTLLFWILFLAIIGASLLYTTNFLTNISTGLFGKTPDKAAAAAARADPIRNSWYYLERLLLATAIFSICLAAAKYLLELIKVSFNRMAFEERATLSNFRFQVISKLYSTVKSPGKRMKLNRRTRNVHLMPDNHHYFVNEKRVLDLALDLYQNLLPQNRDYLTIDDFANFVEEDDLKEVFAVFDKGGNGDISRDEIKEVVMDVYQERQAIIRGIVNNTMIIRKMDMILLGVAVFFTITFSVPIFDLGGAAVMAIFGLIWTAFGFLLQNTARQCFEAIVFVFVEHAYDVSDRVVIDNEYLTVERVEIFTTIFRRWDGTAVYIPNSTLAGKNVYNVRRSGSQSDFIDVFLAKDTSLEAIWQLKDRLNEFAKSETRDFTGRVDLVQYDLVEDRCKLQLAVEYKSNFQDSSIRSARKTKFMAILKQTVDDLGIQYFP